MRVLMVTHQLPSAGSPGTMAPVARQIESLRALGVDVDVVELTGRRKLKYLQALPALWSRVGRADLVHAHFGYCGWLARLQLTKPLVVSFMGDDLLGTPDETGRLSRLSQCVVQLDRWFAHTVDGVIVKSAEMAHVLAARPVHIIPNGVDLDRFTPIHRSTARMALGWDLHKPIVLFPSDPDNPRKGFALARQAVDVAQVTLGKKIDLVPLWGVAPEQVSFYMNACDALIMTSFVEGSPNVVKEALACNLPVVSVRVGDVPELVADVRQSAVHDRDPQVLGASLANMLITGERSNGQATIVRRGLDLPSVAHSIVAVYDDVLKRRRTSSISRVAE